MVQFKKYAIEPEAKKTKRSISNLFCEILAHLLINNMRKYYENP